MDEGTISWSSNGEPLTPRSSTMSSSPPPPPPSVHIYDCPIAAEARDKCPHVTDGACRDCQFREHGAATYLRMLERVCICAQHNPTPALSSPVGQQRLNALERAGAWDLVSLEEARENVAWLTARMGEAIGRVIQARMAGSRPRGADVWVINEARSLLFRLVPRLEDLEGAYSLDGLPVPVHHVALPSSPLWDGWAGDADAAAAAARQSVEDVTSRVARVLDARRQAQWELCQPIHTQQDLARPLVVDGSTPYPYQPTTPTTQASTSASTSDTSDDQGLYWMLTENDQWMVHHEHAGLLADQQRERIQRLPMMSPWTAHTTDQRTTAASTSAARPYDPDHLHHQPRPPSPTDSSIDDILAAISRPRPAESDDDDWQVLPLRPKRSYRDAVAAPATTTPARSHD